MIWPNIALSEETPNLQAEFKQEWVRYEQQQLSDQLTSRAYAFKGRYGGACVSFARAFLGVEKSEIPSVARDLEVNQRQPDIGFVIKTSESVWGHVGVIIQIDGNMLTVVESNYTWNGIVGIRQLNAQDSRILGYRKIYGN